MKKIMFFTILFLFLAGSAIAIPGKFLETNKQLIDSNTILLAKGPKHKDHPHKKGKHKHKKHHKKHHKHKHPFAGSSLPRWAHDCGLPPGLAKQNKVPPGWEKKCKAGYKYYDHEAEFREEVYRGQTGPITQDSPVYNTIYEMDDAECKVKSITTAGDIAVGVAKGAVFGGLIGAAGGAIYGATTDANTKDSTITGAAGGAAGGAVLGGILASNDYKSRYRKCMRNRGHQVN
jgi:hypothetical protein